MDSCAWMNGQQQQVGPPLQSSQAATQFNHDTMRNQQAGTANNSCQYRASKLSVPPPQTAHFTSPDGAHYNKYKSNWQTFFPQTTERFGRRHMMQNSLTQTQPNMTTYLQQCTEARFNKIRASHRRKSVGSQHVNSFMYQNGNGKLTNPYTAYTTAATSLPSERAVCTRTSVPAAAHNGQNAQNQYYRQNAPQHGFSPSISQPGYSTAVSQLCRNSSTATNSSAFGQIWHNSSMHQRGWQYPSQLNPAHNNVTEATSSVYPNSKSYQHEISQSWQRTNERPLNPVADAPQQTLSSSVAQAAKKARIADSLCRLFTAGSDGCNPAQTPSSHTGTLFDRLTECNQKMQPVTSTVAQGHNSNATQHLLLHSRQSLPNTTQRVMSSTQHVKKSPPQQSCGPTVFYVTTTGNGSGSKSCNAITHAVTHTNNVDNLIESSSHASHHLIQMPESISPQRTVKNPEIHERCDSFSSVNDTPVHSSPGHSGMKAVAIVQPLSQETHQVAKGHTSSDTLHQISECTATDKSLSNPEECLSPAVAKVANLRELTIYPENPHQMLSNKSMSRPSSSSSDGTVGLGSDLAGPQDLSREQLRAVDKGSELSTNMHVNQCVSPAAEWSSATSEVPVSQNADKSEMQTDPRADVLNLSSIPTTPWTLKDLAQITTLIEDDEKIWAESQEYTEFASAPKILNMFWDGNIKQMVCKLKSGWYMDLLTSVKKFCTENVTADTVILSQVQKGSQTQLNGHHILKDDEAYSELPHRSTWLNVNEQLDDIDKEFGFSWSFKHCLHKLESDSQPVNSIPAQIVNEDHNKVLPQPELEPVDPGEEKQASTVDIISSQTSSSIKDDADSGDSDYSFEIQVLPPEVAKVIFGQVQSSTPQSMDTDSQPEKVRKISVENNVTEVTLNNSETENNVISPLEQFCCITRWKEKCAGSGTSALSTCQCNKEQSDEDSLDKTLDEEETTVQKNDELCDGSKFHSAIEGENQVKAGDNTDNQIITCTLLDDFSLTVDVTDDDDEKPHSHSDKETKNVSHLNRNDSQSSLILICDSEGEDLSSSENKMDKHIPGFCIPVSDPEEEDVMDQLRLAGSSQSSDADDSTMEIEQVRSREVTSPVPDPEADCAQTELTPTDVAESSLEREQEPTEIDATAALQTAFSPSGKHETAERKTKTLSSDEQMYPLFRKHKKCRPSVNQDSESVFKGIKRKKVFVDATDSEPSAPHFRTVELVPFGSAHQGKAVSTGNKKRQVYSHTLCGAKQSPPHVLSVILSPSRMKSSVPTSEYSVKQRIHDSWRKSFLPTTVKHRKKPKTKKTSISAVSLKKAETPCPTHTKEQPASSALRNYTGNIKSNRWRSLFSRLKHGEENMKNDDVPLKQPDQERCDAGNGSRAVMPFEKNNVLRFSVLPDTFNFVDGSNKRKKTIPISDNSDLAEGKEKSTRKTKKRARGDKYIVSPVKN